MNDLKGQENLNGIQHNSLLLTGETMMLDKINTLFSKPDDDLEVIDRKPLQLDEQQALIRMAAECGYTIKDAREMTAPYGVILSALYAVWYSIEHEIPIFVDNIHQLINLTGWSRSSPNEFEEQVDQGVRPLRAVSGG